MKKLVLNSIRFYQKYLSLENGVLGKLFPNQHICRFTPSCSQYTFEAVEKFGAARGLSRGFLRILRCQPISKGGFDPVP